MSVCSTYHINNNYVILQDFTLESKCSCAYKDGESCTQSGGGGGGGGGDSNKKSNNDPGVVGIVLLCV